MSKHEILKQSQIQLGQSGPVVDLLQRFLAKFGYLHRAKAAIVREAAIENLEPATVVDPATLLGLRIFQHEHGLPVTGQLDSATAMEMSLPRCGFRGARSSPLAEFSLRSRWPSGDLRFAIVNGSADLSLIQVRGAILEALAMWSQVAQLTFTEASPGTAELVFRFVDGAHGDGDGDEPFDGPGNVLAHAFFPRPAGGPLAGNLHFDEGELWTVDIPATGIDLITVAAHEIGHALGLDHSLERGALMFPSFTGPQRFLAADDVTGIRALYGARV